MDHTERLVQEIETHAQLLHISDGSSTSSTLPGIGMVSGRVIKRVGLLTLHGIEAASRHARLVWMSMRLRTDRQRLPERFYEDIMELQRIHLYSKWVRKQAWELIFLLLEQRRSDLISRVLGRWSNSEVTLFLGQLAACRLSDWTLDVSRVGSSKGKHPTSLLRTHEDVSDYKARLTDGFCDLALAIFMDDNSTLHVTLGDELAWGCILLLVEKRRFTGIVAAMTRWTAEDRRIFLHRLASSILMYWVSAPGEQQPCLDDILRTFPCHPDKASQSPGHAEDLTDCCRGLFLEMAMTQPPMLTEAFTVLQFAALQSHGASLDAVTLDSGHFRLSHFFATLHHHPHTEHALFENWMLPLRVIAFIKYLCGVEMTLMRPVVEELMSAMEAAVTDHGSLQALLCFTIHLSVGSPVACHLIHDLGSLDVLHAILVKHSGHGSSLQPYVLTGCALIYSALQAHTPERPLTNYTLHSSLATWLLSQSYTNATRQALNSMASLCTKHYILDQWLVLFQLSARDKRHFDGNPWNLLLYPSIFTNGKQFNAESLAWSASLVIFSCIATQSSEQWMPLMEAFATKSVGDLYAILLYIMRVFVRIPGPVPLVSEPTRSAFTEMYRHARANGRTIVNPMDRFVEFINLVSRKSYAFRFALYHAGAYELISEVHAGFYDFISGSVSPGHRPKKTGSLGPTMLQKKKRQAVCVEVQQGLVAYSAVPAADLGRTPILSPSAQVVARDSIHIMSPLQICA